MKAQGRSPSVFSLLSPSVEIRWWDDEFRVLKQGDETISPSLWNAIPKGPILLTINTRTPRKLRWPTSALHMPNDTPNFKPYSEFLNLTPNSKISLRILEPHSKFQKHHSEFKDITPNSWTSLQILEPHSEFKNITPNSKNLIPNSKNLTPNSKTSLRIQKSHSEFKSLTPNSWTSLRIPKSHSEFLNLTPNSKISLRIQKHHSEFKKTHFEFKSALRIFEPHVHWGKSVVFYHFHSDRFSKPLPPINKL